jgi:hypothetical protein
MEDKVKDSDLSNADKKARTSSFNNLHLRNKQPQSFHHISFGLLP